MYTEQGCFWLDFDGMCSLKKKHPYCCLSSVFISGAPHQFRRLLNPSGMRSPRAQQCVAGPGCSPGVPAELGSALVPLMGMGREDRAQPNQWLNFPGAGICSDWESNKGRGLGLGWVAVVLAKEPVLVGLCCFIIFSLTEFFFSLKSTVPLKALRELKNDLSWIRLLLMIMLIHLIALNQVQTKEWHGKYHKWLCYAQVRGMAICVHLHQSIHTCTLSMFLQHFWPIILCVDFGETFWSSILADVSPSLLHRLHFSVWWLNNHMNKCLDVCVCLFVVLSNFANSADWGSNKCSDKPKRNLRRSC